MRAAAMQLAGLVVAPAAWAVNTQLGQILPYADCSGGIMSTTIASFAAALVAAGAAFISYRACAVVASRRMMFIASLGSLTGATFAFALFLQGAASLLLNACER